MIRSVCIPLLCTHPSISFPYRLGVASSSDDDEGPWRTFERHVRRAQDWEADPQALAGVDADALASLDPRLRIGRLTPLSRREGLAFDLESSEDDQDRLAVDHLDLRAVGLISSSYKSQEHNHVDSVEEEKQQEQQVGQVSPPSHHHRDTSFINVEMDIDVDLARDEETTIHAVDALARGRAQWLEVREARRQREKRHIHVLAQRRQRASKQVSLCGGRGERDDEEEYEEEDDDEERMRDRCGRSSPSDTGRGGISSSSRGRSSGGSKMPVLGRLTRRYQASTTSKRAQLSPKGEDHDQDEDAITISSRNILKRVRFARPPPNTTLTEGGASELPDDCGGDGPESGFMGGESAVNLRRSSRQRPRGIRDFTRDHPAPDHLANPDTYTCYPLEEGLVVGGGIPPGIDHAVGVPRGGGDYEPLVAKDAGQEVGPGRGTVAFRSRRMRGEKGANSGVGRRAREDAARAMRLSLGVDFDSDEP